MHAQPGQPTSVSPGVYALDCSATVYPYLATKRVNQIYRMALELDTQIDVQILRRVVRNMPRRFPAMFVTLRKDKDTYRLETTEPFGHRSVPLDLRRFGRHDPAENAGG